MHPVLVFQAITKKASWRPARAVAAHSLPHRLRFKIYQPASALYTRVSGKLPEIICLREISGMRLLHATFRRRFLQIMEK
jgi:hypothetical protein